MTAFDYAVLLIIGLSVLISLMRGVVREVLSLFGWVVSFYVAKTYASQLAPVLPADIPTDNLKMLAAFVILFLATLLLASLISIALSGILKNLGLGWLNRLLGGLFGFARGLLIVGVLVMLAGMTDLPKDARWTNAMFSSPLEAMVKAALPWLPSGMTKYVRYD
ncbi:MAG: CvpA family protein [Methylophilus sp.]|nr:CvpA family protein [Methylophilus sp.]